MKIDIALMVFALLYAASDVLKNLIFATLSGFKTWVLQQDIQYTYQETNFLVLSAPTIIVTISCLIFLSLHESKKKTIENTTINDNQKREVS